MLTKKISLFPKKNRESIWKYIKGIDYVVLAFLIINSIWIIVIPRMNGFSISDAIAEAGMMATFVLYFPMAVLVRLKEIDFIKLLKVFYWSTFALAIWHCIMWIFEASLGGDFCEQYFNFIGKIPFVRVGEYVVGWGIIRVTISSSILLASGLLLSFADKKPLNIWSFLKIAVFSFAILGTYLKSLWFGVIAGVGLLFIYLVYLLITNKKKKNKALIKSISVVLVMIIASVSILSVTVFKGSTLNRLVNSFINTDGVNYLPDDLEDAENKFDEEQDKIGAIYSNNIKIEQTHRLLDQWEKSPLIGFGYGSSVPGYYRSDIQLFSYEMTMFALLMKIGLVGVAAWGLLALYALVSVIRNNKKNLLSIVMWAAIAGAFLVAIQTNPLLFSANAINLIIFLLLFAVYSKSKKEFKGDS